MVGRDGCWSLTLLPGANTFFVFLPDLVHPGEPVDNSDITPPIPPPSYLDSIAVSSTSRRIPAEPPPSTAVAHASHFRPQPQEGSLSRAGSISRLPIPGAFPSSSSVYSSARPLPLDLQSCYVRTLSTGPLSPPPPSFDSLSPRTTPFRTVPIPISPPPAFSSLPPLEEPPPNPSGLSRPPPVSVEDERSLLVRQAWESLARLGLTFEERVHRMEQVDETLPRLAGPEVDSSDDEEEEDLPMVFARTSLGERPGSFGLALVTGESQPSLPGTAEMTAGDAADGSDSSATPLASSSSSEAPSSTTSSPRRTVESRLSPPQAIEIPPPSRPASAPGPVLATSPSLVAISSSRPESAGPAGTVRPMYSPPPQLATLPWQMEELVPISLRLASVPDTHPPQTSEMVDEDNNLKLREEVQAKEAMVDQSSGASEPELTSTSAVPSLLSSEVATAIDAVASTALRPAQPVIPARAATPSSSPVAAAADLPPATVLPPSVLRRGRPLSLEINKQSRLMLDGFSSGDSTPQLQTDSAQPASLSAPTGAAVPSSGVVHGGPPFAPPVDSSCPVARPSPPPHTHSAPSQLITPASALRRPPPPVPPRPAFLRFPVNGKYGTYVDSPPTSPRPAQSRSSTSTPPSSYKPPPAPESPPPPPPLAPQRGFMPLPPPPAPPSSPLAGSPLRSPLVIQQIAPLSPSPLSQDPVSAAPTPPPLPPRPRHLLRSFGQPSPVEPLLLLSPAAPLPTELIAAPPPILARPQPPFLSENLRGLSNISTSSSISAEQHQPHGMPTPRPLQETSRRSLEKPGGSSSASQDHFGGSQLRPVLRLPPAPTATATTATTAAAGDGGKSERPWAVRPLPPIPMGLRVLPAAGPRPAVDRSAPAFSPASPLPPPVVVSAPAMRASPPQPPAPRRPPPPPPPPSAAATLTRPPPSRGVSSSSSTDSLDRPSATPSARPVSDTVDSLVLSSRSGGEREYTDLGKSLLCSLFLLLQLTCGVSHFLADLLVLRLDQADADQYEVDACVFVCRSFLVIDLGCYVVLQAATTIQSFLGPARPPGLSFSEFEALPRGEVVEVSRRTTREGKTKIKVSMLSSFSYAPRFV